MKSKYCTIPIILLCVTIACLTVTIADRNQRISQLISSMSHYNFLISRQIKSIAVLEEKLNRTQVVKISLYHPATRGINSDSDPTKTATMRKPTVGKTVAISDELFYDGWLGFKVYIDQYGVFVAEDRMGVDENGDPIKGRQIDICVGSEEEALILGVKYGVVAVKL